MDVRIASTAKGEIFMSCLLSSEEIMLKPDGQRPVMDGRSGGIDRS
jgi:hypothetical protein